MQFSCQYNDYINQIVEDIYQRLKRFNLFNRGYNRIATVDVDPKTQIAYFDENGWLLDLTSSLVAFNDNRPAVQLSFNDAAREVSGQTLGNHMLVGIRKWRVLEPSALPHDKSGGFQIVVETESYDRARNWANSKGLELSESSQLTVWEQYLMNIYSHYQVQYNVQNVNPAEMRGTAKYLGFIPNPWGPTDQRVPSGINYATSEGPLPTH